MCRCDDLVYCGHRDVLVCVVVMYVGVCCGDVCWWIYGDVCWCLLWWCICVCVVVMYVVVMLWCVLWTCGHVLVCCVDALVCVVMLYWWVIFWYGGVFWLSICMLPWCLKSDDCCDNIEVKCASCNLWWCIMYNHHVLGYNPIYYGDVLCWDMLRW